MEELREIVKGLWCFPIVLPNNPLKWLNCYVIKGTDGGRNLLIDTGFKHPLCQQALDEGMASLALLPEETDVFITHYHSDHSGNARYLQDKGCRIIMGSLDYSVGGCHILAKRDEIAARALSEGVPADTVAAIIDDNPGVRFGPGAFDAQCVEDGYILRYGDFEFECMMMPGHTPGHICLYEKKRKIMILGDHVLFDITPNICARPEVDNILSVYINNLQRICGIDVELALPGHRTAGSISMSERAERIIAHHERRLDEICSILREHPDSNAYEITALMSWKIRAKNWDDFPLPLKWTAIWEAFAHLDMLVASGRIVRTASPEGIFTYRVSG